MTAPAKPEAETPPAPTPQPPAPERPKVEVKKYRLPLSFWIGAAVALAGVVVMALASRERRP